VISDAARPPKQEWVYREIRARIRRGVYSPGYRLVIDQLARDFRVSSIPVREAVRRLEAERLVAHTPHVGFQVMAQDARAFADTMETLAALEGYAARLAAPHHSPATLQALRAILREMSDRVEAGDPLAYGVLDRRFHAELAAPGPNTYVKTLIADGRDRLETLAGPLFTKIPARMRDSIQEHYQLVEMLFEHGPEGVLEQRMREHVLNTLAALDGSGSDTAGSTPDNRL
jgi:DNA-binding GntR family transcriptional regulator